MEFTDSSKLQEHPCKHCTSFWEKDSTCMDCRMYPSGASEFPTVHKACSYYNKGVCNGRGN